MTPRNTHPLNMAPLNERQTKYINMVREKGVFPAPPSTTGSGALRTLFALLSKGFLIQRRDPASGNWVFEPVNPPPVHSWHESITPAAILAESQSAIPRGFCLECGHLVPAASRGAKHQPCQSCRSHAVYGVDWLLPYAKGDSGAPPSPSPL